MMDTKLSEIVDYWSLRQSECDLSVDWSEAHELCWRCAHKRKLQRCHIIPRSLGGSEEPSNLVLLCGQCHAEAPNVSDPTFMWVWLQAHAVSYCGTYWQSRAIREYEFIFKEKPYEGLTKEEAVDIQLRLEDVTKKYVPQTGVHWGQGKPNPSTMAWVIRKIEQEIRLPKGHKKT